MINPVRKIPEHEAIYQRIREMILFGELVPGQPVTIQGLAAALNAGVTPVREALRRLTAEGALAAKGNRRISVPELTRDQLDELYLARLFIEPKLAQMALQRGNEQLGIELRAIDDRLNTAIENGDIEGYLKHNYEFHFHLYAAANAEILTALAQSLWLRSGPLLRVVCGRLGTANLPDKHDAAIIAIQNRDAAAIAQAIKEDLQQGVDHIRQSLKTG